MKKYILSLIAAVAILSVLAGCTHDPEPTPTPDNEPGSVEFDDSDLSGLIDDDLQTDGAFGDIDVSFKDPNHSDGIVVTPKETKSPTPSTTPKSDPAPTQKPTSTPVQTPTPTPAPTETPDVNIDSEAKGAADIDIDLSSQGSTDIDIDVAPADKDQDPAETDSSMRFGDFVVTPKDPNMDVVITPKEPVN